jgi:hypothetical protein
MCKSKTETERMTDKQKCLNIAITINYLDNIIRKHRGEKIDDFLGSEIDRLRKEKKRILKNDKNN